MIAAHGTRSAAGLATTHALVGAVARARPEVRVEVGFLDVAAPTVADTLDRLDGAVVVVPLLLAAGFHVHSDIPQIVAGRPDVRVARHLGPDPLVLRAVAARLRECDPVGDGPVVMAAIASSRSSAREEVDTAVRLLSRTCARGVRVLALDATMRASVAALGSAEEPFVVATYLLAEGGFLDSLRAAVAATASGGRVAAPIGVHPDLVQLIWARYDAEPIDQVG